MFIEEVVATEDSTIKNGEVRGAGATWYPEDENTYTGDDDE